jgi:hypothetical protein
MLERSVHRAWIRISDYLLGPRASMWLVHGMVLGVATALLYLAWLLSFSTWRLMWMG